MKKATKKEVLDLSVEQEEKYFNLVWFARKSQKDMEIPEVKKGVLEVIKKYPTEVKNLQGKDGDWEHGFNSGCLAAFRFIITAMTENVEDAKDFFPELDS